MPGKCHGVRVEVVYVYLQEGHYLAVDGIGFLVGGSGIFLGAGDEAVLGFLRTGVSGLVGEFRIALIDSAIEARDSLIVLIDSPVALWHF